MIMNSEKSALIDPYIREIPLEGIYEAGIYENNELDRWEIWYVDEDGNNELFGFCKYKLGVDFREMWIMEFYHRWQGVRNDKIGDTA